MSLQDNCKKLFNEFHNSVLVKMKIQTAVYSKSCDIFEISLYMQQENGSFWAHFQNYVLFWNNIEDNMEYLISSPKTDFDGITISKKINNNNIPVNGIRKNESYEYYLTESSAGSPGLNIKNYRLLKLNDLF